MSIIHADRLRKILYCKGMAEKGFSNLTRFTVIDFKNILFKLFRHWILLISCSIGQQGSFQNSSWRSWHKTFLKAGKKSKTLISSRAKINCSLIFLKEMERWDKSKASTDMASTIYQGERRNINTQVQATISTSQIQQFPNAWYWKITRQSFMLFRSALAFQLNVTSDFYTVSPLC